MVGINFGGDEARCKAGSLLPIFNQEKDLGLGITIHAGESVNAHGRMEAIYKVKPNRVSHATAFASSACNEEIMQAGLHIEAYPTSNYILGYLSKQEIHPAICDLRLQCSIHTDYRTFFAKNLTEELFLFVGNQRLDLKDIASLQKNAINDAFTHISSLFIDMVTACWSQYA